MIYLTLAELLYVAERTLGAEVAVRDHGLLQAALARPQASAFGSDAYPSLEQKAAALMHSLARNPCVGRRQQKTVPTDKQIDRLAALFVRRTADASRPGRASMTSTTHHPVPHRAPEEQ